MILMDDIIREGHPTLRKVAKEVELPLSEEDKQIALDIMEYVQNSQNEEMIEKYGLRPGIGLAAPQINVSKRIFALHIEDEDGNVEESMIAINPKIVSHSVEIDYLETGEGCLSVDRPVEGHVPRYARITIEAYDENGEKFTKRLRGLPAIAFQHELDHLDGILFFDRIDKKRPFLNMEQITQPNTLFN